MTASFVHSWQSIGGEPRLGMLVRRRYRMEPGRRATPLVHDLAPLYLEPVLGDETDGGAPLVHECDLLAFERPLTDVLVAGSAHSVRGEVTVLETGVEVGAARKRVRVHGERRLRLRDDGSLGMTDPEGFCRLPIEWTRAYGGRDRHAERRTRPRGKLGQPLEPDPLGVIAYPRNRIGRGFALDLDRDRLDGALAPNLDDPSDPVRADRLLAHDDLDWIDRPVAASYGPIDLLTFPRCMSSLLRPDWAPPAHTIAELGMGALAPGDLAERSFAEPIDARICNAAPAGLARCRLEGAERLSLWNLHAVHEQLDLWLPAERPVVRLEPPGAGVREPAPLLQELLVEPDFDRITLTWTASLPVGAVFPEPMCREMRHEVHWVR